MQCYALNSKAIKLKNKKVHLELEMSWILKNIYIMRINFFSFVEIKSLRFIQNLFRFRKAI